MSTLSEEAKKYASQGMLVFPASTRKTPLIKGWSDKATKDETKIDLWWIEHKHAQIGLKTGYKSGFFVVDIDEKNGQSGIASITKEYPQASFDPDTQLIATTPSGGLHLYYLWDETLPVNNSVNILEGVDIRGNGGLIIAPPSRVKAADGSFRNYKWCNPEAPLTPPPDWVRDLVTRQKTTPIASTKDHSLKAFTEGIPQGERDTSFFKLAWLMRTQQIEQSVAIAVVRTFAEKCRPPFPEEEAIQKVIRAYSYNTNYQGNRNEQHS